MHVINLKKHFEYGMISKLRIVVGSNVFKNSEANRIKAFWIII